MTNRLLDEAKRALPEATVFKADNPVFKYLESLFGEKYPELFGDAKKARKLTPGIMVIRLPEGSNIDKMLQQEWKVKMTPVTIPASDNTPPLDLFLIGHDTMRKEVHSKTGNRYAKVEGAQSNSFDLETELEARAEAAGFKTSIMR